jgi:hypothetical protein
VRERHINRRVKTASSEQGIIKVIGQSWGGYGSPTMKIKEKAS